MPEPGPGSAGWTRALPLRFRILAVNFFVVALLAGALFYIGSYRDRLVEARLDAMASEARTLAIALEDATPRRDDELVERWAVQTGSRVRLFDARPDGGPVRDFAIHDSDASGRATYRLIDPDAEPARKHVARAIDAAIDWLTGKPEQIMVSSAVEDPVGGVGLANHLLGNTPAEGPDRLHRRYDLAPDRTPYLSVVVPGTATRPVVLVTQNARDITRKVRAERGTIALVFFAALLVSVLLSLYLARTIVKPLRRLAIATVRVRLGRDRAVVVPRLPGRTDEIGMLARAVSDMTRALRERIDAGESFAADVAHELKNPISSLRSSLAALGDGKSAAVNRDLLAIANDDCRRLDRLVTDIAEASRMDAELSRAEFERVDLGLMIADIVAAKKARLAPDRPRIAYARPRKGSTVVMGDDSRLERVIENLLANALSFTPGDGVIRVSATHAGDDVIVKVEDTGPGVPPGKRDEIFRRFHSIRPAGEDYGGHSGLGLAIARTIVEGHQGSIVAGGRDDGLEGACFEIRLPAADR